MHREDRRTGGPRGFCCSPRLRRASKLLKGRLAFAGGSANTTAGRKAEPRRTMSAGLKLMRSSRRELLRVPFGLLGAAVPRLGWAGESSEPPWVVLQPLGSTAPAAELEAVSTALAAFYAVRITVA